MASRETARETGFVEITPEVLLKAYACGIFPMAENADDPSLYWIEPERRGVIPLEGFHLPRAPGPHRPARPLPRYVDRDFEAVIDGCAEPQTGRSRTWINRRIRSLYCKLHEIGHCHSVEAYDATASWSAGSMACGSAAPFSARACSISRVTPPRSRSCIWWRGCARAASPCSTRNSSPII